MAVRTVVLDANVYVSALAFDGKPKRTFQLGITRRVHVAVSEPIRTEVLRTLRDKFRWSEERLADASRLIGTAANRIKPREGTKRRGVPEETCPDTAASAR